MSAIVVTPFAVTGIQSIGDDEPVETEVGLATEELATGNERVPFADAPDAEGVFADISGSSGPVKEISSETPFTMVGVTWEGDYPSAEALVRAETADGGWTEWFDADAIGAKHEYAVDNHARGGVEPIWLGTETTTVQIALSGVDFNDPGIADTPDAPPEDQDDSPFANESDDSGTGGSGDEEGTGDAEASRDSDSSEGTVDSGAEGSRDESGDDAEGDAESGGSGDADASSERDSELPTRYADIRPVAESSEDPDVQAVLLSPDQTPTPTPDLGMSDAAGGEFADIQGGQPSIVSRSGWGVSGGNQCGRQTIDPNVSAATIHHTAGSNNYSAEESASIVRGIHNYHTGDLGWCDIGYHVLVDKYGQAFQGIYNGLDQAVRGAHTGGFNGNTFGISMMGDYQSADTTPEMVEMVGAWAGARLAAEGVDPTGSDTHYSEGTSFTFVPRGQAVDLPNIFAHRDVGLTNCPGDNGYAQMDNIRNVAKQVYDEGGHSGVITPPPGGGSSGDDEGGGDEGGEAAGSLSEDAVREVLTTVISAALGGEAGPETLQSVAATLLGQADTGSVDGNVLQNLAGADGLSDLASVLQSGNTLDALRAVQPLLNYEDGGPIGEAWQEHGGESGPLGAPESGVQEFGDVSLAKFSGGAVYYSAETGAHPLWGLIGDTWAAQGFEHGPLGLPVGAETQNEDGTFSQEFENGTLTFDPATGEVSVAGE